MGICSCCQGESEQDEKKERLIMPQQQLSMGEEEGHVVRMGLRAFIIAKHERFGYLLLEANKKRKGGRHYQLPGGHVDRLELTDHGEIEACRVAAARELFEETGLDLRNNLGRLTPVELQGLGPEGNRIHGTGRRYFKLTITDADRIQDIPPPSHRAIHTRGLRLATPLSMEEFCLCLSSEHTGYKFEKSLEKAIEAVIKHSGGENSNALRLIEGL